MWIGENDTKTMEMFCFVFAEMKTDTFENPLAWMGPKKLEPLNDNLE